MKLNLTRDMIDIERKILHRLIDIEAIYRAPLPLRKILVTPGSEGPNQCFENLTLIFFLRRKLPSNFLNDRQSSPLRFLKISEKSDDQISRNLTLNI